MEQNRQPEVDSHEDSQQMFEKRSKDYSGEKNSLFNNWSQNSWTSNAKLNLDTDIMPFTIVNSK